MLNYNVGEFDWSRELLQVGFNDWIFQSIWIQKLIIVDFEDVQLILIQMKV